MKLIHVFVENNKLPIFLNPENIHGIKIEEKENKKLCCKIWLDPKEDLFVITKDFDSIADIYHWIESNDLCKPELLQTKPEEDFIELGNIKTLKQDINNLEYAYRFTSDESYKFEVRKFIQFTKKILNL
jgi:hypothetical protein